MESNKVRLHKGVAEAIKHLQTHHGGNEAILAGILGNANGSCIVTLREYIKENGFDDLLQALVNGYEVEQTPEDKVKEQYNNPRHFVNKDRDTYADVYRKGIIFALDTLNIKIKGVNDHE